MRCRWTFSFSLALFVAWAAVGHVAAEENRVKLRWMGHWKGEGGREKLVHEVRDEFQFLHPDIDLEFTFAKDFFQKKNQTVAAAYIAEMIRSGELEWDVIWLDPLIYGLVAKQLGDRNWGRKHLVDFFEVPGFKKTQKAFLFNDKALQQFTGDILTGSYIEGFFFSVWYNKLLADQLGLEIREEGMTAEELLGYVKAVHTHNQTAKEPVSAFLNVDYSGTLQRLYLSLLFSAIGSNVPDAGAYDRTDAFFVQLEEFNPLGDHTMFTNWTDAAHYMLEDNRALFYFGATWRYSTFESACPEKLGNLRLAQIPSFDGKGRAVGGYIPSWAVLKNAPGREAGIELMRFWSRPPIAQKWVRYTKCPTGLRGDLYDSTFGQDIHAGYQRKLRRNKQPLMLDPLVYFQGDMKDASPVDLDRPSATATNFGGEEE